MLACVNKKMKVRMKNDYKSIALPAELQGHDLICRINSLFNQVIQYLKDLSPARMLRMLAAKVPQCRAIVTHLSVCESVWDYNPILSGISHHYSTSLQQINTWSGKYESNKIYKN